MSDQRKGSTSYLPIYSYREAILQSVREHSTTIIVGETGCGKSTQLPQYIADYYLTCPNHNDLDCGNDDDSDFKNKDIGKGENNNNNNNNMNNMNKNKKRTHSDSFYPDSSRQGRKKNLVVCTQPRRVAAVTIAQKVATERKKQSLFLKPIFLFTIIVVVFLLCLM